MTTVLADCSRADLRPSTTKSSAVDVGTHLCACDAAASSKSSRSLAEVKPDTTLSGYVLAHLHTATVIGCLLSGGVCVCARAVQPANTVEGQREEREADYCIMCVPFSVDLFSTANNLVKL